MDLNLGRIAQISSKRKLSTLKAHRTEKDRQQMSLFEKFTTEGNEEADDAGWRLMAQARASTVQQEREEVCAAFSLADAASFTVW